MDATADAVLALFGVLDAQLTTWTQPLRALLPASFTLASSPALRKLESPFTPRIPLLDPINAAVVVLLYLAMVAFGTRVWPRVSDFKFTAKHYAMAHNLVLTALSAFMCIEIARQAIINKYKLFGNELQGTSDGWGMARIVAIFYLSKILEFNDTFIMIIKRNYHQVSFLHVYHHASIFVIWWLVTLWAPTGESYFSAMLNSFIHVIMYGYYFLSALGVKQVSVVKKYITSAQMTQFMCMMVQATYNIATAMLNGGEGAQSDAERNPLAEKAKPAVHSKSDRTPYPFALSVLLWVYMVSMLSLFANFYRKDRQREAARRKELAVAKTGEKQQHKVKEE